MPYYLDNAFLLNEPLDHRGRLRRDRRLRRRRPVPTLPREGGHDRASRSRPGGAPTTCCARTSTPEDVGQFKSKALGRPAGESPTDVRSATPSTHSGSTTTTSDPTVTGTPACRRTATASSSAAPTTPPHAGRWQSVCPSDPRRWLIDAGNDTNWGQVLVGNVAEPVVLEEPPFTGRDLPPCPRADAAAA